MSTSITTTSGSLDQVLSGKGCWEYDIKQGPLTRKEADDINATKGYINKAVATGTTILLETKGKVKEWQAEVAGEAMEAILNRMSKNLHQGDVIIDHVKACPSDISDSGYSTEVSETIIEAK